MSTRGEIIEHTCSCGHKHRVSERAIAISTSHVKALWSVYKWCREKGIHEFETRDVKHLWDKTQYATFGDLVYFGGLVYKNQKAHYGLNMERCHEFFRNELGIAERVWKNPITREVRPEGHILCRQVPHIMAFLDADGYYVVEYRSPQPTLV